MCRPATATSKQRRSRRRRRRFPPLLPLACWPLACLSPPPPPPPTTNPPPRLNAMPLHHCDAGAACLSCCARRCWRCEDRQRAATSNRRRPRAERGRLAGGRRKILMAPCQSTACPGNRPPDRLNRRHHAHPTNPIIQTGENGGRPIPSGAAAAAAPGGWGRCLVYLSAVPACPPCHHVPRATEAARARVVSWADRFGPCVPVCLSAYRACLSVCSDEQAPPSTLR